MTCENPACTHPIEAHDADGCNVPADATMTVVAVHPKPHCPCWLPFGAAVPGKWPCPPAPEEAVDG